MPLADRILDAIRFGPLDDDVLARRLGVPQRQSVNIVARRLEGQGLLKRYVGADGKIVNELVRGVSATPSAQSAPSGPRADRQPSAVARVLLSEDEVKKAVADALTAQGFVCHVMWGRDRGIDIEASHPDGRRWVVEAKGEVASDVQNGGYFLGAIGELVQRMSDQTATYALALPDNRRYRGLVRRLPALARQRLGLVVLWVRRDGEAFAVEVDEAPQV